MQLVTLLVFVVSNMFIGYIKIVYSVINFGFQLFSSYLRSFTFVTTASAKRKKNMSSSYNEIRQKGLHNDIYYIEWGLPFKSNHNFVIHKIIQTHRMNVLIYFLY